MACWLQVDNALTAAQSVLFPKGLDTAVATSRQQHAANVEAANEAREAYLTKASLSSPDGWQHVSGLIACIATGAAQVQGGGSADSLLSQQREVPNALQHVAAVA